jgi:hypothetical protein
MRVLRWLLFLPSAGISALVVGWLFSLCTMNMAGRGFLLDLLILPVSGASYVTTTCVFVCVGAWTAPSRRPFVGVFLALLVFSILGLSFAVNGLMWATGDWAHDEGPVVVVLRMGLSAFGTFIGCILAFRKQWMYVAARGFFILLYVLGFGGNALLFMAVEAAHLEGNFIHAINPLLHIQLLITVLAEPGFWVLLLITIVGLVASKFLESLGQEDQWRDDVGGG